MFIKATTAPVATTVCSRFEKMNTGTWYQVSITQPTPIRFYPVHHKICRESPKIRFAPGNLNLQSVKYDTCCVCAHVCT